MRPIIASAPVSRDQTTTPKPYRGIIGVAAGAARDQRRVVGPLLGFGCCSAAARQSSDLPHRHLA
jgi:hypothetical protein